MLDASLAARIWSTSRDGPEVTLLPGPLWRIDRSRIPPRRSSLTGCDDDEGEAGEGSEEEYFDLTQFGRGAPNVRSIPLRDPSRYAVLLVKLLCESSDRLGARWKYLLFNC
jgi:hypothetical protein